MLKVMNVDDSPDMLHLMDWILQKEGYNVIEATSGEECLEKLEKERPDVILLDVMMPGINGWEICKQIKGDASTRDIPVVMFTIRSRDEDIARSFEYAGAEWHVSKPFKIRDLLDVLKLSVKPTTKIEREIEKAIQKKKKIREVFKMMNPKMVNFKYDILFKGDEKKE
ncbi:MAG: PleD family two-component system response regulator [Candidatus Hydrothermarchaeales archaeon]